MKLYYEIYNTEYPEEIYSKFIIIKNEKDEATINFSYGTTIIIPYDDDCKIEAFEFAYKIKDILNNDRNNF